MLRSLSKERMYTSLRYSWCSTISRFELIETEFVFNVTFAWHTKHCHFSSVWTVDGGWSGWGAWGACSLTCGQGQTTRTRRCDKPPPQHGGRHCPGEDTDLDICVEKECPGKGPCKHALLSTIFGGIAELSSINLLLKDSKEFRSLLTPITGNHINTAAGSHWPVAARCKKN